MLASVTFGENALDGIEKPCRLKNMPYHDLNRRVCCSVWAISLG